VNVSPTPLQPTLSVNAPTLICNPSATSYQWYLNGSPISGATSQTYVATQDGWYSVWIGNSYGCQSSSSSVYVIVTGIVNSASSQGIFIHPNPANDFIEFTSQLHQTLDIRIIDIAGKEVWSGKIDMINKEKYKMDLSAFESGIYLVEIKVGDIKMVEKLLKN
jgi:hypothetical protein